VLQEYSVLRRSYLQRAFVLGERATQMSFIMISDHRLLLFGSDCMCLRFVSVVLVGGRSHESSMCSV